MSAAQGTLWIGTQNGLNSLDPKTGRLRAYDTRNGMPANTVACILEDDQGDIWLSTTKGLSKLTPATGTFANYSLVDGLPGNDLTGWATCSKSRRGELFFAGFAGAVAFVPTALQEARLTAPLVLTDFEIDGVKARIGPAHSLERAVAYSERVTLTHQQRNFSVTFAGLRYANPETTRYRYRLDGLDSAWHESPSSIRQATYHNSAGGPLYPACANGGGQRRLADARRLAEYSYSSALVGDLVVSHSSARCLSSLLAWWVVRARVRYVAREVTLQMEARNNERMRIAQDLHDTLLQGLLSASFQLSSCRISSRRSQGPPLLEHVANLLRQLVQGGPQCRPRPADVELRLRGPRARDFRCPGRPADRVDGAVPCRHRRNATAVATGRTHRGVSHCARSHLEFPAPCAGENHRGEPGVLRRQLSADRAR